MLPADYSTDTTPADYRCCGCGATGVRLWRPYGTAEPELRCRACTEDLEARILLPSSPHTIGWHVAAVPDETGVGWWGYTTVPAAGLAWWLRLPLRPEDRARVP